MGVQAVTTHKKCNVRDVLRTAGIILPRKPREPRP